MKRSSGMKFHELDKQEIEYQFVTTHFRLSMNKERAGCHFGIQEIFKIDTPPSIDAKFSLTSNCKRYYIFQLYL